MPASDERVPDFLGKCKTAKQQNEFLQYVTARYFPEHIQHTETSEFFKDPPPWPPQRSLQLPAEQEPVLLHEKSPLYDVEALYKAYKRAVEEDDADPMGLFGQVPKTGTAPLPPPVRLIQQQLRAQLASRIPKESTHKRHFQTQGRNASASPCLTPQLPLSQAVRADEVAPESSGQAHSALSTKSVPRTPEAIDVHTNPSQPQVSFREGRVPSTLSPQRKQPQKQQGQQQQQPSKPQHEQQEAVTSHASLPTELLPACSKASVSLVPVSRSPRNCITKQPPLPANEVQLVANAPAIAPSGRGVHPLFLLGVLQHGLSGSPSAVITGSRTRRSDAVATPPVGWSTAEVVANCVQPALGATRLSYVQALACNAAEVPWCPYGRFTPDLVPQPRNTCKASHLTNPIQTTKPSSNPLPSSATATNKLQHQQCTRVDVQLSGGGSSVPLPADLAGKSAYGSASFFLSHPWACSWAEMVGAVLQHYLRLPEVQRSEGKKFVPVYYWVDAFAVPQAESQQSSDFKHHRADVLGKVAASCQSVLLLLGRPCTLPSPRGRRRSLHSTRSSFQNSFQPTPRHASATPPAFGGSAAALPHAGSMSRANSALSSQQSGRLTDRGASGSARVHTSVMLSAMAAAAEEEGNMQAAVQARLALALPSLALSRAWCLYECGLAMTLGLELQILLPDEQALPTLLPPQDHPLHTPGLPSNLATLHAHAPQFHPEHITTTSPANGQARKLAANHPHQNGAGSSNSKRQSAKGIEVTTLVTYIEQSLLPLLQDIRHAQTTLRADHDFVVTQVGLSFRGPELFSESLRHFLQPHLLSAVLLVVLRAPRHHINPLCIFSPEQVMPAQLADASHLTSKDPSAHTHPLSTYSGIGSNKHGNTSLLGYPAGSSSNTYGGTGNVSTNNSTINSSDNKEVDWKVACCLAEGGAILQWMQPSFVVSVPSVLASTAAAAAVASQKADGGTGKANGSSKAALSAGGLSIDGVVHNTNSSTDGGGCMTLEAAATSHLRHLSPSSQPRYSGRPSADTHMTHILGEGSRRSSLLGSSVRGSLLDPFTRGADEAAAFFGVCLQRGLPCVATPSSIAAPAGMGTANDTSHDMSAASPEGLLPSSVLLPIPGASSDVKSLGRGTLKLSSLRSEQGQGDSSTMSSGVLHNHYPGFHPLNAQASIPELIVAPPQPQAEFGTSTGAHQHHANTGVAPAHTAHHRGNPSAAHARAGGVVNATGASLHHHAHSPRPKGSTVPFQHTHAPQPREGSFKDRSGLRVSISGSAAGPELMRCSSPQMGSLPSSLSSPVHLAKHARRGMRESSMLSVASGVGPVGPSHFGSSFEGRAGRWLGGGWGAVHEGMPPSGLYNKILNRLQMLIFEDPGEAGPMIKAAPVNSSLKKHQSRRNSHSTKAAAHALGGGGDSGDDDEHDAHAGASINGAGRETATSRASGGSLSNWVGLGGEESRRASASDSSELSYRTSIMSMHSKRSTHAPTWSLSTHGIAHLAPGLQGNTCLTHLVLSGHSIGSKGVCILVDALQVQPNALQVLLLRRCKIGEDGGQYLGELLSVHRKLRILDLSENAGLKHEGVEALAQGLALNTTLQQLLLSNCRAHTQGATAIAEALLAQHKQQVMDQSCFMAPTAPSASLATSAGAEGWLPTRVRAGLQVLSMRRNHIGPDAGAAFAAALSHFSSALITLFLGDNLLETKGALHIVAALSAAPRGSSLRTLELRHNGLALEVGDAFGCLLAGTFMPPTTIVPPARAARRSRAGSRASTALKVLLPNRPSMSNGQIFTGMLSAAGASPGGLLSMSGVVNTRMGPLEAAALQSQHNGPSPAPGSHSVLGPSPLPMSQQSLFDTPASPQPHGVSGLAPANVEEQQQQQGCVYVPACYLSTLDLGCNPLLGDVGVCKLAAGLATHCRHFGRLRELLLDECGIGEEGTAALVSALTQQPQQQQLHQQQQQQQQAQRPPKHPNMQQLAVHASTSLAGNGPEEIRHKASKSSIGEGGSMYCRASTVGEKGLGLGSSGVAASGATVGISSTNIMGRYGRGLLKLDLSDNNIGRQGLLAISGCVSAIASLQELLLRDCQIDTDGRLTLLAALQLYTACPLRHLDLRGNGINPASYTLPPLAPMLATHTCLALSQPLPASLAVTQDNTQGVLSSAQPALEPPLPTSSELHSVPSFPAPTLGLQQYKQLLCSNVQVGTQEGDQDTDLVDLGGGQNSTLNINQRLSARASGKMEGGLSRHERDLAQSLNLARKLQAPPRCMHIEL